MKTETELIANMLRQIHLQQLSRAASALVLSSAFFSVANSEQNKPEQENVNFSQSNASTSAAVQKPPFTSIPSLPFHIIDHFEHFQILSMLRECAKLLVFDNIPTDCQTPISVSKLSQLTDTKPDVLYRILRALASFGYTKQVSKNSTNYDELLFVHTEKSVDCTTFGRWYSTLLFKSSPLIGVYFNLGEKLVKESVKEKHITTFAKQGNYSAHDTSGLSEIFNDYMYQASLAVMSNLDLVFNFNNYESVCDLGGGVGHLLASIMYHNKHIKGYLYERPKVIENSQKEIDSIALQYYTQQNEEKQEKRVVAVKNTCEYANGDEFVKGFRNRLQLIEGDFLITKNNGPAGLLDLESMNQVVAQVYILKWVLDDWLDKDCNTILKNINYTMKRNGGKKLLLIGGLLNDPTKESEINDKEGTKLFDVHMLMMNGGKERTFNQYKYLLETNGFRVVDGKPKQICDLFWLIEAEPV